MHHSADALYPSSSRPSVPAALNKASISALGPLNASSGMHQGGPSGAADVNAAMQQLMAAAAAAQHVQSGRRSLDAQMRRLDKLENPAIANAR